LTLSFQSDSPSKLLLFYDICSTALGSATEKLAASTFCVKVIYRKCLGNISRRSVGPNGSHFPIFPITKFFGYKPSPLSLYTVQTWSKLMLWMSLTRGALAHQNPCSQKYMPFSHIIIQVQLKNGLTYLVVWVHVPHHMIIWNYNYCISRAIRRTFFPKKCDLNLTCVLRAEGKYYFKKLINTRTAIIQHLYRETAKFASKSWDLASLLVNGLLSCNKICNNPVFFQ
jgi:hypothetical protein